MNKMTCKFCKALPIQTINGKPVSFSCGTRANNPSPRTVLCWTGWIMELQGRIAALEALVNKPRPRTVREMAIAGGWHPEHQTKG